MAGYTEKDLERIENSGAWTPGEALTIAQLIVEVRNETIERCAVICDGYAQNMEQAAEAREKQGKPNTVAMSKGDAGKTIAWHLRALKDGAE